MELKILQVPDLLVGAIQRFLVMQVGLSHPKSMLGWVPGWRRVKQVVDDGDDIG